MFKNIVVVIFLAVIMYPFMHGCASAANKNYESDDCENCSIEHGKLSRTTKFSMMSSSEIYTIIQLSNERIFVYPGNLTLGPVGAELEIVSKKGVQQFPSALREAHKHANTAVKVKVISFPSGLDGLKVVPTN